MKVGIIVYSYTGNTLSIAKLINKRSNNKIKIEEIKITGDYEKGRENYKLKILPNPVKYDLVILACPVQAFSLSPVMVDYIREMNFTGQKIIAYVTQFFPYPFLGGNRALKQMENELEKKNRKLDYKKVINWKNKKRDNQTEELIKDILEIVEEVEK